MGRLSGDKILADLIPQPVDRLEDSTTPTQQDGYEAICQVPSAPW